MEERLLDEFDYFCRYKCKFSSKRTEAEDIFVSLEGSCDECGEFIGLDGYVDSNIIPCEICQIKEFINIARDIKY